MHARENRLETRNSGGGISEGGERGYHRNQWKMYHIKQKKGQSLVTAYPLFWDWYPNNEQARGSWRPDQNKERRISHWILHDHWLRPDGTTRPFGRI